MNISKLPQLFHKPPIMNPYQNLNHAIPIISPLYDWLTKDSLRLLYNFATTYSNNLIDHMLFMIHRKFHHSISSFQIMFQFQTISRSCDCEKSLVGQIKFWHVLFKIHLKVSKRVGALPQRVLGRSKSTFGDPFIFILNLSY